MMKKKAIYIKYKDNNKLNKLVFQIPTLLNINSPEKNDKYYILDRFFHKLEIYL